MFAAGTTCERMDYQWQTILVCDDDREIAAAIDIYLTAEGYKVIQAYDGLGALEALESNQEIKLILMDIMMPRLDGVRATMKIRETRNIPIIMLSARSEDNDKILGLNIGADDYITKPFNPLELIARVRSQLRRYSGYGTAKSDNADDSVIVNGGLEITTPPKRYSGRAGFADPCGYKIVRFLMENGGVFSPAQIYESVWNEPSYGADNIVAVHIRHIRER